MSSGRTVSRNTIYGRRGLISFHKFWFRRKRHQKMIVSCSFFFFIFVCFFLLSRNNIINQLRKSAIFLTKGLSCQALKFSIRSGSGIKYFAVISRSKQMAQTRSSILFIAQWVLAALHSNNAKCNNTVPLTPNCIVCLNITGEVFFLFIYFKADTKMLAYKQLRMSRLDRLTIQATTTAYSGTYKFRPNKEVPIKLGGGGC